MSSIEAALKISQGLLTPVIAAFAVYIAWRQYAVNKDKLQLDRYERRLKVYHALTLFIGSVLRHANLRLEDLAEFDAGTAEADFVFCGDEQVKSMLVNVRNVALSVMAANAEYRDWTQEEPPGYDHRKVVKTKYDGLRWFAEQQQAAQRIFRPYLVVQC